MRNWLKLTAALLGLHAAQLSHATHIWMEAENGAEYNPMIVGSDTTATDDTFLVSWRDSDYTQRSDDDGRVVFEFHVPTAGLYTLWGRVRVPFDGASPYDISVGTGNPSDDSQWTAWAPTPHDPADVDIWYWQNSGFEHWFDVGFHRIHLIQTVGGHLTHIDKILLTDDSTYTPTGEGEPEPVIDIINPFKSDAVEKYGQLQTNGSAIVDQNQNPIQLQGISLHGLQWFPIVKQQTIPSMAEFFGVELVRLAMYVEDYDPRNPDIFWGGYMSNPEKLTDRVEQAIQDAIAAGVYVIVDWHLHDDPSKYTAEAADFFGYIAETYGHHPNIIYEICNEPVAVTWSGTIKPYAETIIQHIRAHDPNNLIVVGTPTWSQDIDTATNDPINAENIVYAFHFYSGTHDLEWAKNNVRTAINNGQAIMVTEWGSSDVGTSFNNFSVASQWLDFLQDEKISWANWSLGLKDESSSILKPSAPISGPWTNDDLTEAGAWLLPYFDDPSQTSPSDNTTSEDTPEHGADTPAEPVTVRIQAEALDDSIGHVSTSQVVGYFNRGDALIYRNINFDHLNQIRLYRSSRTGGFNLEIRKGGIAGQLLARIQTQSMGGWNNYGWRTIALAAASGIDDLYIYVAEDSNNGGVMNIDYFELDYGQNNTGQNDSGQSGSGQAPGAPANGIHFSFDSGDEGWTGNNLDNVRVENGWLKGNTKHDPQFRNNQVNFDSQHYPILTIHFQANRSGEMEFFWASGNDHFSGSRRTTFQVDAGVHTVQIDLRSLDNWRGSISKIRIDPPGTTGSGETALDSVSFSAAP